MILEYGHSFLESSVQCIILLALFCAKGEGYSHGSGYTACKSPMEPKKEDGEGHGKGIEPQKTAVPYELKLDKTSVNAGGQVEMILQSTSNQGFMGFLLVVRKENKKVFYGTWKDGGQGDTQMLDCSKDPGVTGVGATHTGSSLKSSVKVYWVAPKEAGKYSIYFTVLASKTVYWNEKRTKGSHEITVSRGATQTQCLIPILLMALCVLSIGKTYRPSI